MHHQQKSYEIRGHTFVCYFYSNGYDKWISVFDEEDNMLFKYMDPKHDEDIVLVLDGYVLCKEHCCTTK